ncbi:MAG: polysaccharide pyruvyl transferase [Streptosporangiaceae bacterium]|jgi:hypothetical protein|nr:polysaccharide pyruvyl transferase [Streptosporangiaceae bacterium]
MRVLLTGWFSFVHGEVTAGDALALAAVHGRLVRAGIPCETAWSPVFRPDGMSLDDAPPSRYSHLVFVCGPLHGPLVSELHTRYAACRRIAVGVSVIDPADPAVRGFHLVLARDVAGDVRTGERDLAAVPGTRAVPVVGVILTAGQGEYGRRRRHALVSGRLTRWLQGRDCARVPLDTRLDSGDWRLCATPDAFASIVARLDLVVTTRLHGLVVALRQGVPALAVDPVAGGGKVTAQAAAWDWPAVLGADDLAGGRETELLRARWDWCLSEQGRRAAHDRAGRGTSPLLRALVEELRN